ncbi:Dirigent protein [Forsythia ovata]|uniref:Dirigent protein n=1 Tax=Forsythia ovata TaxID=205694 RepID=A0ABD1T6F5_9LAMI
MQLTHGLLVLHGSHVAPTWEEAVTTTPISHIAIVGGTGKYENTKWYATIETPPRVDQYTSDEVETITHPLTSSPLPETKSDRSCNLQLGWYGGHCGRDDFFGKVQAVLRLGRLIGIMLAVRERARKRQLLRRWKATGAAIYSSVGMAAVVAEAISLAKFRRCFD